MIAPLRETAVGTGGGKKPEGRAEWPPVFDALLLPLSRKGLGEKGKENLSSATKRPRRSLPPTLLKYCGGKKGPPTKEGIRNVATRPRRDFFCQTTLLSISASLSAPPARSESVRRTTKASCLLVFPCPLPACSLSTLPSLSIINSPSPAIARALLTNTEGRLLLPLLLLFRPGSYSPSLLCEAAQKNRQSLSSSRREDSGELGYLDYGPQNLRRVAVSMLPSPPPFLSAPFYLVWEGGPRRMTTASHWASLGPRVKRDKLGAPPL